MLRVASCSPGTQAIATSTSATSGGQSARSGSLPSQSRLAEGELKFRFARTAVLPSGNLPAQSPAWSQRSSNRRIVLTFGTNTNHWKLLTAACCPKRQQVSRLRARLRPLFPVAHTRAPTPPLIQFRNRSVVLRDAKVAHPTAHGLRALVEPVLPRDPCRARTRLHAVAVLRAGDISPETSAQSPTPSGETSNVMLEVLERSIRPTQLAPAKREAREHARIDQRHPTLLLVAGQLQAPIQVPRQTGFDPLARPIGLDRNDETVGVPREAVTPSLQFPIQTIEQDVSRQGRDRPPCRARPARGSTLRRAHEKGGHGQE